ncbi:DUF120 domain-containing protein [Natrarchaeobius oligotrophus]|uniref:DUF120 domain-containing protein n=1 Tax=Natrarchaeobius oligotrophus TaxID=3455743 RepID=UPI001405080C|nr:DUF120 domain-containing protein [Natrarchaeobius chitinivorans]
MNGRITGGEKRASEFVAATSDLLEDALGFRPYPGTLNLNDVDSLDPLPSETHPVPGDDHCAGIVARSCRLGGMRAAVIRPLVPDYPEEKTELVAPVRVRSLFGLEDGDAVRLTRPDRCAHAAATGERDADRDGPEPDVDGRAVDAFDAVVFDLDNTLVTLDVNWSAVHRRVESLLEPALEKPLSAYDRLAVFELAAKTGRETVLESLLREAELAGARTATALPALAVVDELACPVGVCTANAERAAEIALERFDVRDDVGAIVGRDTIPEHKPHPRTLETVAESLGVECGNVLYVGDEEVDATLAVDAGASYVHPDRLRIETG